MGGDLKCLRCDGEMKYIKTEEIQLGKTGLLFGDLSNLLAGALEADIYSCNKCGKIEFFTSSDYNAEDYGDKIEQISCPHCGKTHDIDYPKCPFCKYKYY